jgi:hypothetical protein
VEIAVYLLLLVALVTGVILVTAPARRPNLQRDLEFVFREGIAESRRLAEDAKRELDDAVAEISRGQTS